MKAMKERDRGKYEIFEHGKNESLERDGKI